MTDGPASAETPQRGGCLCGGVRYEVQPPLRDVLECHCHRCQKTSGNFVAATLAPESAITFDADTTLRWYHPSDDPNVEYGFCGECGSSLFFRLLDRPVISIMAGALDGPTGLHTAEVWFSANAADHVVLNPSVRHHPSEPER